MKREPPQVHFRLRISRGDDIAIGPGKIDLLEAIERTGSITAAAKALGMSYRRAWLLVDMMNRCFVSPVVAAEVGGPRGGGTRLTALGCDLARRYRRIEATASEANTDDLAALMRLLR
jgi:molybdate transport system regulatory protein